MSKLKPILTLLAILFTMPIHAQSETWLTELTGKSFAMSSLQGKWVFINFWASWCQPCRDEIPELNEFYQAHSKQGKVALFGVNFDSLPIGRQQLLIKELDIRYPALQNNTAHNLRLGHIGGVPVTFVYNPQGELAQTLYGPQTVDKKLLSANGQTIK